MGDLADIQDRGHVLRLLWLLLLPNPLLFPLQRHEVLPLTVLEPAECRKNTRLYFLFFSINPISLSDSFLIPPGSQSCTIARA